MSDEPSLAALRQLAFFHAESACVRFWIEVDWALVGASVGRDNLHYRFHPRGVGDDPLSTYLANATDIDEAVRRRLVKGSTPPVMLREADLQV